MNELVSVIVPIYNCEKYIEECVKSVLNQTYKNLEIILVNDGSTDKSLSIIEKLGGRDERIKILTQKNQGVSVARNQGICEASGSFLCFIDADDLIEKDYIQGLVNSISEHDVVFCNYKFLYSDGSIVEKEQRLLPGIYKSSDLFESLIDDGTLTGILFGSVWGALYRTSLIRNNHIFFNEEIKVNEDGLFNVKVLIHSPMAVVLGRSEYLYRQRKIKKSDNVSFEISELNKATDELKRICVGFPNYELQFDRRLLSIVFWTCLRVQGSKGRLLRLSSQLKRFCSQYEIAALYEKLDFNNISKAKKYLIGLLKKHHYLLFVFVMRCVVPFASRRIKH